MPQPPAPIPADEDARVAELERYEILYLEPEEVFDRVTAELARIFDVPLAEVTLIDRDTQYIKAHTAAPSMPKEVGDVRTLPRRLSLCAHAIAAKRSVVVSDMSIDPRFADSDLVKLGARFYAGMPLMSGNHALGTLCLIDKRPRKLSPVELELLQMVANGVVSEIKLRSASRSLIERTRAMADDLTQARAVQRFLLPPAEVQAAGYVFTHAYRPMEQIGGDFLDVKQWDDGSVALLVADVSGHGASAALMSAMTKTAFLRCAAERCTPSELLTNLNRSLEPTAEPGRFMTALAVTYNPATRQATLASAGHPAPLVIRGKNVEAAVITTEIPLLIESEASYAKATQVNLSPGDRLLLFTDGAVEAKNTKGELLSACGLQQLVADAHDARGPAFLHRLFSKIDSFADGHLNDDVAIACLDAR